MHKVIILLGSNINPQTNIETAKRLLQEAFAEITFSPAIRTKPVGYKLQQDFLNAVAKFETDSNQEHITAKLKEIEDKLKRVRDPNNKNGPRTIDLDIIMFDGKIIGDDYDTKPFIGDLLVKLR